ncbi:ScbA/BarX family gamma-butyrolactone biosynthesis protein [Streptomyces sp. H51]|uniref:ScbA/BarX family gamma-butyrolactone biosynthesis protein n=1 Tax=Streptomyces sp. H51 TaxID=3111770 RepID=UPI002D799766|nr:ScbA/BarX family gamma-butyrolactone biosynthesis protein [Streptomyces sp. H51]
MPYLTDKAPAPKTLRPGLTTTVPREYVHRTAVSEVLLTGWEHAPVGPDEHHGFLVRAQWPRCHALFAPGRGYQDPMLLIESVRQAGSLLAHAEFDVPFGHQFLMSDISVDLEPELLAADPVPTDIQMHTACRDVVRRGGLLREMRYDTTVLRENGARATATAAFRCMSPDVYQRLRGRRPTTTDRTPPPAVDPATVGHNSTQHVVLGPRSPEHPHTWELRVDTTHPTYFDHPVDHIPGMLLLEAARQAAHASAGLPRAVLIGLKSTFTRYAELDAPCWITAHCRPHSTSHDDLLIHVHGTQRHKTVFTADLTVRPPAH